MSILHMNMSPHTADIVAFWATVISIIAALITGLSAGILFVAQNVQQRDSDLRIAQAKIVAIQAKNDANEAALKTEQLRQKVAWRSLSEDQMKKINVILKGINNIQIIHQNADPESKHYSDYFRYALINGGFNILTYSAYQTPEWKDIGIYCPDINRAKEISDNLSKEGIKAHFSPREFDIRAMGGIGDSEGFAIQILVPSRAPPEI